MVERGDGERGATSVIGLMLMLAVTVVVAATVSVFVFGIDTDDVTEAAEDILDMDDDIDGDGEADALAPLLVAPLSRYGTRRDSAAAESRRERLVSKSPS